MSQPHIPDYSLTGTNAALAIASQFLGQTAQAAIYFNQSLLEDPTRNNEDTPPPPVVG